MGRSVWEVELTLKAKHGDPQARVASIGRAGESQARIAAVINDLHRAAGRSGVGAVMGSKNLKAMIVRGTGGVSVKDPARFMAAVKAAKDKLDPSERRIRLGKFGTHAMMDATHSFGSLPTRNCRDMQFEGVKKINAKSVTVPRLSDGKPNLIGTKACFGCTIACGRMGLIDPAYKAVEGKERYQKGTGGLEYENAYAFGPMCGIDDLNALMYANMVCNEDGLDTISFGATLSAAMELFEIGAITTKETGGIDLSFGNADALIAMVELTGKGEGFGKEIGLGSKRLCEKYGHPELSMTVRGQEFPGYEPRAMKGMGLAYATSSRGLAICAPLRSFRTSPARRPTARPRWSNSPRTKTPSSTRWACAPSPDRSGTRRTLHRNWTRRCPGVAGRAGDGLRRAHLEHGASVQHRSRIRPRARHAARQAVERTGQKRRCQRPDGGFGEDAARIL